MRLKSILIFLLLFLGFSGNAQGIHLSPTSKISVLTCGPGEELYSSFGHSAFRIQDSSQGIDIVYNYGIFDTGGENFYYKFSQGRMDYLVIRSHYTDFLEDYKIENRWVNEQILNLDEAQRNELFDFLENNARPENRVYSYDYFHNNCATKIWEVLKDTYNDKLVFDENYITTQYSIRELIRQNLKTNTWGQFGIDTALGSVIDRKATIKEHLYLPEYISKQLKTAKLNSKSLSSDESQLLKSVEKKENSDFFTTPLFVFVLLLVLTLWLTYGEYKSGKRSRWFDFLLFFIIGLHGFLIFYLWFLTDHVWTVENFKHFMGISFECDCRLLLLKKNPPKWISKYLLILLILIVVTLILWVFKVQTFSILILPFCYS